ncbi:MAG: helix-turn-helix domain-containing protein [Propionibacteriaceae bacterium]|nr:helix-turn-helix domain-containing protein [Propionibacteriaceae bacterium]
MIAVEETYSPAEVAAMLGVSTATIHRHIADGIVQAVRKGTCWRVTDSEVDRYGRWRAAQVASVLADEFPGVEPDEPIGLSDPTTYGRLWKQVGPPH